MSVTAADYAKAIKVILDGAQEYEIGDRRYRFADLDDLRKAHDAAAASERSAAGTMFQRVRFAAVGR